MTIQIGKEAVLNNFYAHKKKGTKCIVVALPGGGRSKGVKVNFGALGDTHIVPTHLLEDAAKWEKKRKCK